MFNFHLRAIVDADIPGAKALWKEVFRDADEYIESFFETLKPPGIAAVSGAADVSGGDIIAHFFSIPGIELITGEREYAVSYLAALATSPKCRGAGIGAALTRATAELAFRQGGDLACLMPANEGLYGWYARAIGTKTLFYTREREFRALDLSPPRNAPSPEKISAADYCALREALLSGMPHARFGGRFPDWIAYEYRTGGLYRVGDSCAAVSLEGGMRIGELLCPESEFDRTVSALSAHFGAASCVVSSPAFLGTGKTHGKIRPTVVAAARAGLELPEMECAYWGFAFD